MPASSRSPGRCGAPTDGRIPLPWQHRGSNPPPAGGRGPPANRKEEVTPLAPSANLDKVLDKQWEDKPLQDILAAPVTALAGVSDTDAEHLAAAFNIRTVQDLGSNKYFAAAGVLVALSRHTS